MPASLEQVAAVIWNGCFIIFKKVDDKTKYIHGAVNAR